jgi:hypothetical protein
MHLVINVEFNFVHLVIQKQIFAINAIFHTSPDIQIKQFARDVQITAQSVKQ